jgi:hypothetical protein
MIGLQVWSTIVLIAVSPTGESLLITAVMKWPVLLILGLLLAGPFIAWYRLVKVRARREQLKRSEWMLDGAPPQGGDRKREAGTRR